MPFSIGIDVGGTKVLGGIVNESGVILSRKLKETPREGGNALTKVIGDVALELLAEQEVDGIGISAAGFISADRKTIVATPNIAGWNGVNLADQLSDRLQRRVVLENDANAAAWGEFRHGAGVGFSNLVMLTIGTGLGGGLIVDGALFRGGNGMGAEFGHMRAVPEGHLCGCGARGCYEQYASGNALLRHAREAISAAPDIARNLLARGNGTIEGLTGRHLTEASREGDPVAISAFASTGQWIGALIATLIAGLDPQAVVIGGGVIDAGEMLLKPARETMHRLVPFGEKHPMPIILPARLGNDAGLVGAADLAHH